MAGAIRNNLSEILHPVPDSGRQALYRGAAVVAFWTGNYALGAQMIASSIQDLEQSRQDDPEPEKGQKINLVANNHRLPMIVGQRRMGGVQIAGDTELEIDTVEYPGGEIDVPRHYLLWGVAHCATGPQGVEKITDVWIGDDRIPDAYIDPETGDVTDGPFQHYVRIHRHTGKVGGIEADDILMERHTQWSSNHLGQGIAYTVVEALRNEEDSDWLEAFPRGWPNRVTALVHGEKVYDPRESAHDINDPDTWEWSDNPALCAAHYLTRPQVQEGGVGVLPNPTQAWWDEIAAEANICDEEITVPDGNGGEEQIRRYTCNAVLDATFRQNLKRIAQSMAGKIEAVGHSYMVRAGQDHSPSWTVTDKWLRDGAEYRRVGDLHDRHNSVNVSYTEPSADWEKKDAVPFVDADYEEEDDDQRLPRDIEAPAITNRYRAQQLAIIRGRQTRRDRAWTLSLGWLGLTIPYWTVGWISDEDGPIPGVDGQVRVRCTDRQVDQSGVRVKLEEVSQFEHSISKSDFMELEDIPPAPTPKEKVPPPTDIQAESVADGVELIVVPPQGIIWDQIEWYASDEEPDPGDLDAAPWEKIGATRGSEFFHVTADNNTRYYRCRAVRPKADPSAWSEVISQFGKLIGKHGANTVFEQEKEPEDPIPGDLWWRPSTGRLKRYHADDGWKPSSVTTHQQDTEPTEVSIGDYWYNTSEDTVAGVEAKTLARWTGSDWQPVSDLTEDKLGGDGHNLLHANYSVFLGREPPPHGSVGVDVESTTANANRVFGDRALLLSRSSSGDGFINLRRQTAGVLHTLRGLSPGKKYIVSLYAREASGNATLKEVSFWDAGTVIENQSLTDSMERYSGVIEATSANDWIQITGDFGDDGGAIAIDAIMVEEKIGKRALPSEFHAASPWPGDSGVMTLGGQVFDIRSINPVAVASSISAAKDIAHPLTTDDDGSSARIDVDSFTLGGPFGETVYPSGAITGLSYDTPYLVYVQDEWLEGSSNYQATTSTHEMLSTRHAVFVGSIVTADEEDGNGGGNGGDPWCVSAESWITPELCAREARAGMKLLCIDPKTLDTFLAPIQWVRGPKLERCVDIETGDGDRLTLSRTTPMPTPDLGSVVAGSLGAGDQVIVATGTGPAWVRVSAVRDIGRRSVMRISLGNKVFAARGVGRPIFSHNTDWQKP